MINNMYRTKSIQILMTSFVFVHLSTESSTQSQQSVPAVQCTQKSDSRSQMQLPPSNAAEIPVLPVSNNIPGCEGLAATLDSQLRTVDFANNREAAAAAGDNSNDALRSCCPSVSRRQPASTSRPQSFPSAAVPPSTCASRPQRSGHQKGQMTSPVDKSRSSASSSSQRQPSRPVSQQTQTSSVAGDRNSPNSVHVSSSGKVSICMLTHMAK